MKSRLASGAERMYGAPAPCLLMVFSNPRTGADDDLARWYTEVHGPDSLQPGSFYALHRYAAVAGYAARFLALWEAPFASRHIARARIVGNAGGLRDRRRISPELEVVWSSLQFLTAASTTAASTTAASTTPAGDEVRTLTVVEGVPGDSWPPPTYTYGDVRLYESANEPDEVAGAWAGMGQPGMAPHGPYRSIFEDAEGWPPPSLAGQSVEAAEAAQAGQAAWVSHWRPIGSLRRAPRNAPQEDQ